MAVRKPQTPAEAKQTLRLARFKKLMKNYQAWGSLVKSGESNSTLRIGNDEFNFYDILDDVGDLPPRQRLAFELICLKDMKEVDAAAIMGFNPTVSTPIQQYCLLAIKRLLYAHDARQRLQEYNELHYISNKNG